jgi:hypothetical protein
MKRIIAIMLVLALAGSASAEFSRVGSAGAQFLKIGVGSRYQGIGESSVAVVNDVYSMYWNPAGLAEVQNSSIGFTNVNWVSDISLNYVGYAHYFDNIGVFGLSAAVLSMGQQEITTVEQPDGTGDSYSSSSYSVGVSFARQLTNKFAFGASVKYIGEKIHLEQSRGFAFDFGTMLYMGFRSLRMGMSISNIGPELQFSGPDLKVNYRPDNPAGTDLPIGAMLESSPYDLPLIFRVGAAYDFNFGPKGMMTLSAEMKHPSDNERQGSLGAEFGWNNQFFLRSGYKLNYEEETVSFGGGLKTNITAGTKLVIDYSWQDFGRLESAQRFSVGFTF